jgi:hypothetical protein
MRLYRVFFLLVVVMLFSTCRDEIGEALFEMDYPPRSFTLPAGANTFVSSVVSISNIPSNYPNFLNAGGYSAMDVTKVVPRYARLVSVDGLDTGFLSEVSLRICPNNQQDCTLADEAFYIDNIYRRNISNINLQPGLANFKDLLSSGLYRLEVVFSLGEISPYSVDFRLEYGFQAFR